VTSPTRDGAGGSTAGAVRSPGHSLEHTDQDAQMSQQSIIRTTEEPVAQAADPRRVGDRVFAGFAVGSGVLILVILALVAGFLVIQGAPALFADPAKLVSQGYGEFASWVLPYAFGTLWAAVLALVLAVPVAIGIALFISHYAPRRLAQPIGYLIDLLAAVPSVVFGLWGSLVLAPAVQPLWAWLNANLGFIPLFGGQASGTGRTILTAAIVLATMVLPIITSLCREVFLQTPKLHEEAALALGATHWEMVKMAVFPFARPGIIAAVMLGLGRALGETMAVTMVLSGGRNITFELLTSENPNTIAATIAQNFPEAFGLKVNQLIAAGLVLFVITLAVNMVARWIVSRRAQYSGAN
jgi:phosphate transport system permease protein